MLDWLKIHAGRILITIIIGLVGYFVFQKIVPRFVKQTINLRMRGKPEIEMEKRSSTISKVINNAIGILLFIVVLFTILAEIGINIGPALASLGILGLAISFGAQSLIKDLINGIFILMENQYGIGDVIKVAGVVGLVEEVNLKRTILRDLDGVVHYVPNGEINIASNFTKEYSRVNMNISIAYRENLDRVIKVINKICVDMAKDDEWREKILKIPQVLRVDAFGELGVEIKIFGDTQPLAQWEVMGELRKRIKDVFDKQGIEIARPYMKVFLDNAIQDTARVLKK